jgi:hypothetical protein
VEAPLELGLSLQDDIAPAPKSRTRASQQKIYCGNVGKPHVNNGQAKNDADASYQEWLVPDAVL